MNLAVETSFFGARFKRDCKGSNFFQPDKFFFTFLHHFFNSAWV